MRVFIIACLFSFLLGSCDYGDTKLVIHNSSMDTVFFAVLGEEKINESLKPYYYRTENHEYWEDYCLVPGESEHSSCINTTWENLINNQIHDKKLRIVFFKKQFLDTTDWKDVVQRQLFTTNLEYTVEDLVKFHWIVTYRDSLSIFILPPDTGYTNKIN